MLHSVAARGSGGFSPFSSGAGQKGCPVQVLVLAMRRYDMFTAFRIDLVGGVGAFILVAAIGAGPANAQGPWLNPGPMWYPSPYNMPVYGGFDAWGNATVVTGSRLNPGADFALPGTYRTYNNGLSYGNAWIGADGLPHGNHTTFNPFTGRTTTTLYAPPARGSSRTRR
jgi:hypothetical protein